jgi:hypothetical protein
LDRQKIEYPIKLFALLFPSRREENYVQVLKKEEGRGGVLKKTLSNLGIKQ